VNLFETIDSETRKRHLQFLIIGGLAINQYGFSRETADLDLLVCVDDRAKWFELFATFGYGIFNDGGNFVQFSPPEQSAWPVDLMLVQQKTFKPMCDAGREVDFYGVAARIPSLEHLLALKLHALKNARLHRFLKDFLDVENLIRINQIDIGSENMRQLFLRYGTIELYEKISRSLASE
jgi:predicted nucleotidyltransferase